jgi:hypothetical protein
VDILSRKLEQRVALKNPNAVVEYSQIIQLMDSNSDHEKPAFTCCDHCGDCRNGLMSGSDDEKPVSAAQKQNRKITFLKA